MYEVEGSEFLEPEEVSPSEDQRQEAEAFLASAQEELGEISEEDRLTIATNLATMISLSEETLASAPVGYRHTVDIEINSKLLALLSVRRPAEVKRYFYCGEADEVSGLIQGYMRERDD